ncbi:MAG: methyltransferase, partial [Bacteroidetes bacterium]|nr:methyltransferase [Bacteroidota bacterium]
MTCCYQTEAFDHFFDHKTASGIIKKFHKKGPDKTTKILIEALKKEFIDGYSLLDIGGGIGAIQLELFKYGLDSAINIDASLPFINVSKQEVRKQGYADKVKYYHNNFVDVAG